MSSVNLQNKYSTAFLYTSNDPSKQSHLEYHKEVKALRKNLSSGLKDMHTETMKFGKNKF
jgi:hypothetical protein